MINPLDYRHARRVTEKTRGMVANGTRVDYLPPNDDRRGRLAVHGCVIIRCPFTAKAPGMRCVVHGGPVKRPNCACCQLGLFVGHHVHESDGSRG